MGSFVGNADFSSLQSAKWLEALASVGGEQTSAAHAWGGVVRISGVADMSKPSCLCCENWDNCYRNATCDACRNGDKWEAKGECKGPDGVLRCDSCKHSANDTLTVSGGRKGPNA